jgi:hypothetical protein
MNRSQRLNPFGFFAVIVLGLAVAAAAQAPEKYTATAAIKAAGGAAATAPVTIEITRKMSEKEAEALTSAFKTGGAAALRKALNGVTPTGSIAIGAGKPIATRLTIERASDRGRMLTIVTDQPLALIGAGLPGAKPAAGFDFGIVDFVVDGSGNGAGTMSPAAKVTVKQGAFVVDEYSGELIRLTGVKLLK